MSTVPRVAVLMTSFNRRELTLRCLHAVDVAAAHAGVHASIFLVDDASTDGTADSVRERYPNVHLLPGGNLYWARGMHRAFAAALNQPHEYFLWLNDDTLIKPDALSQLLACEGILRHRSAQPLIVVGSTVDQSGQISYGGEQQVLGWSPIFKLRRVLPTAAPQPIDTMNGNIVLINAAAAKRVGNLDPAFEHAMGDIDYGLRAKRQGVGLWLAPGVQGICNHNTALGTYLDASLPLNRRMQLMLHRKGLPWRSWLHLTRRHGAWIWPVLFIWPYARLIASAIAARATRRVTA